MYNFLMLFNLLGAGTGAAYFLRLRLLLFLQAAPALRGRKHAAPAPQSWYYETTDMLVVSNNSIKKGELQLD